MKTIHDFREAMAFTINPGDSGMEGRFASDTWFPDLLTFSGILDLVNTVSIPAGYREYPVLVVEAPEEEHLALNNDGGRVFRDVTLTTRLLSAHKMTVSTEFTELLNWETQGRMQRFIGEAIARRMLQQVELGVIVGTTARNEPIGLRSNPNITGVGSVNTWDEISSLIRDLQNDQATTANLRWLLSPLMAHNCRTLRKFGRSTPQNAQTSGEPVLTGNTMAGVPVLVSPFSSNARATVGDFSQLTLGYFGDPIITIDRATRMGIIRVDVEVNWDFALAHTAAFRNVGWD